jgi:hypothetical protein
MTASGDSSNSEDVDLYDLLQLDSSASQHDIKLAYSKSFNIKRDDPKLKLRTDMSTDLKYLSLSVHHDVFIHSEVVHSTFVVESLRISYSFMSIFGLTF